MRARHSSIIKYVIAYVIIASLTLLLLLMRPTGTYLVTTLIMPTTALVTTTLISDFIKYRSNTAADVLRRLVAPSLFAYLLIGGLTSILINNYRGYSLIVNYLMNFLALVIIGAIINRYLTRQTTWTGSIELLFKYLSYFFIFLGLAYLFGAVYLPLFYPFAAVSIIYLILAPVTVLENRGINVKGIVGNSRPLALAAFGIGLMYSLFSIPKPSSWNLYILITFIIIASISIIYAGYRLYLSGLGIVESIEEELYERHKREIEVVPSHEYSLFEDAVKEFITNGKKDKLIAYLVHELTNDGLDYETIINRLDKLINYSSVTTCRRVSRRVLEMEVKERIDLVNELLNELLSTKNTKFNSP
ncbi:hypothetical protein JCM16161A_07060 [Vulcanisaeta sp. JCM 16161]|uniref:hypothetical protein n=1 Tax=Vulcanisaeta sp. JCM 16161 TaxID=1295372 RepID=UPI0006D09ED8|nr:hypothetical protein [Vulcanisaeta sp. JCM 16161]